MPPCQSTALKSARSRVSFKGVDWSIEKEKSEKRQHRRSQRKSCGEMNSDTQLQQFLAAAAADNEQGKLLRSLSLSSVVIAKAAKRNIVQDGLGPAIAVSVIWKNFTAAKNSKGVKACINAWFEDALEEGHYSIPPVSPSSKSSSSVSDLSSSIDLNSNIEMSLLEFYRETVQYTCMKGKLMGLKEEEILEAVIAIFNTHDTFSEAFFSTMRKTLDEVQGAVCEADLAMGITSEEHATTTTTDVDTVHSLESAVTHLKARALTFVMYKLSESDEADKARINAIQRQFFKSTKKGKRNEA